MKNVDHDEDPGAGRSGKGAALSAILTGCVSGLLASLAFPPGDQPWLAWMALVPLLAHLRAFRGRRTAFSFFAFGIVFNSLGLSWLSVVLTAFGPPALALVLTVLYFVPCGWVLGRLVGRGFGIALAAPLVWAVMEWLRAFLLTGFPWLFLAHSQAAWTDLIQVADIFGAYGLTAVIVLVNASVVEAGFRLRERRARGAFAAAAPAAAVLAAVVLYGGWRIEEIEVREGPRVLLVQGNVPQYMKTETFRPAGAVRDERLSGAEFILRRHLRLTRLGLEAHPSSKVVIWPETMFPYTVTDEPDEGSRQLRHVAERVLEDRFAPAAAGRPGILGAMYMTSAGERRNSAFLIDAAGGIALRYDKVHAVPGGEYIPLRGIAPEGLVKAVGRVIKENAGFVPDLTEGEELVQLPAAGVMFQPLVCYEIGYPELSREAREEGCDVLLNLTNYGWFPGTDEPEQANQIAVFRAVETRRPVVVAANTGITTVFSPRGTVAPFSVTWYPEHDRFRLPDELGPARHGEGEVPEECPGYACGEVPLSDAGSLYAFWGDLPWCLVAAALLAGLVVPIPGRRRAEEEGEA